MSRSLEVFASGTEVVRLPPEQSRRKGARRSGRLGEIRAIRVRPWTSTLRGCWWSSDGSRLRETSGGAGAGTLAHARPSARHHLYPCSSVPRLRDPWL